MVICNRSWQLSSRFTFPHIIRLNTVIIPNSISIQNSRGNIALVVFPRLCFVKFNSLSLFDGTDCPSSTNWRIHIWCLSPLVSGSITVSASLESISPVSVPDKALICLNGRRGRRPWAGPFASSRYDTPRQIALILQHRVFPKDSQVWRFYPSSSERYAAKQNHQKRIVYQQAVYCNSASVMVQMPCSNDVWPNYAHQPISYEQFEHNPYREVIHHDIHVNL